MLDYSLLIYLLTHSFVWQVPYSSMIHFIQKINNQGFSNLFVKEFSQGEKTLYRVYLGVFLSKTEAETAQKELKEKAGIEGVVTELK